MRKPVKILKPSEAVKLSTKFMQDNKFFLSSRGKDSFYFSKLGQGFKIRVSDHIDKNKNSDVLVDLIFDYDTIESDVETRIKQAAKQFDKELVFRKNRRY